MTATKIKIVTDSSAQLTPEEIADNNITVVPLSIELDGTTHVDGETITRQELITALKAGKFPKTSQPPVGKFVEIYDELGKDGSEVVAVMMTDVLSGTYSTACSAAEMTDTKVTVINSHSTDRGLGWQALAAAKDAAAGKSVADIKQHCADLAARTEIYVLVDTLDNLVKGGRVSRLAGAITKLINLKIIVKLTNESLDVAVKGRSRKTFYKFCQELAQNNATNPLVESALSNVGCDEDYLAKIKGLLQIPTDSSYPYLQRLTSPIIMTHTGLNAIGVINLRENPIE